jgi:hypothetical protein
LAKPPRLRVFISSPGDVAAAREVAAQTIEQVALEHQRFFEIEAYLWENEAMLASGHFQDSIDPPSKFDIVVLILGARLGTPLPERTAVREYRGIDGRTPVTGTEWEFEDALAAARARGAPDLLVYRSKQDVKINAIDIEVQRRQLQQLESLNNFWSRHFADRGAFIGAYGSFDSLERLATTFERDLRSLIRRRIERLGAAPSEAGQAPWLQDPFRGLDSYDFEHAPIYFGRNEALGKAMLQLIERSEAGEAFLLVLGASGSGKSSLVKAGLGPRLFEARRAPGACVLRRVVFQPGETADGEDVFAALARRLITQTSPDVGLPELIGPSMASAHLAEHLKDERASPAFVFARALDDVAARAKAQGRMLDYQHPKLLLIVDQLEELFTSEAISQADRSQFVALLEALARSGSVLVIATMRSDVWHRAAETPQLVRLAEGAGRLDLVAPSPAEIGQMIRLPAQAAGLSFETHPDTAISLDDRIAEEAAREPGALPLLSYLLDSLYRADRAGARLTYAAFERAGRLKGAIAARADDVLADLAPEVSVALPRALFALVQFAPAEEGAKPTPLAKRAPLALFVAGSPERQVVEALAAARLLVLDEGAPGEPVVRVAHEALITEWVTAREAIVQIRAALAVRRMVEERRARAVERADAGPRAGWLAGPDLVDAQALAQRFGDLIGDDLKAFIERSEDAARRQRRVRVQRLAVGGALTALILAGAISATVFAAKYYRAAQVQRIDRQLLVDERSGLRAYGQGDFHAALTAFLANETSAERLVSLDAEDPQWRYNLAAAHAHLAYTMVKLRQTQRAAGQYQAAVQTLDDLARRDAADPSTQADRKALQAVLAHSPPASWRP